MLILEQNPSLRCRLPVIWWSDVQRHKSNIFYNGMYRAVVSSEQKEGCGKHLQPIGAVHPPSLASSSAISSTCFPLSKGPLILQELFWGGTWGCSGKEGQNLPLLWSFSCSWLFLNLEYLEIFQISGVSKFGILGKNKWKMDLYKKSDHSYSTERKIPLLLLNLGNI